MFHTLGTMKTDHQEIFVKIKDLLSKHATIKVDELDYGSHLTIDQTGIWLETDAKELTIGYGLAHTHYDPKRDNLKQAVEKLFNLLTKRKKITLYLKGDKVFRERTEIELGDNKYQHIGTAINWIFPFWKSTTKQVTFENSLMKPSDIENEINEIYNLL